MSTTPNNKWDKPQEVSGLDVVFGGDIEKLLPPRGDIPQEFYAGRTDWCKFVSRWFFKGLPDGTAFRCKEGVDGNTALRHLRAIMCSFEPKHEHKTGGVAWMMSLWFEDVVHDNKSLITGKADEP